MLRFFPSPDLRRGIKEFYGERIGGKEEQTWHPQVQRMDYCSLLHSLVRRIKVIPKHRLRTLTDEAVSDSRSTCLNLARIDRPGSECPCGPAM